MDFQSNPDGKYKRIMAYQDHLTKSCNIKPLTSKKASEVAFNLIDVFTIFGAPHILQSDNGHEFTALVISELKLMWPEVQNWLLSMENLDTPRLKVALDIHNMLTAWMRIMTRISGQLGLNLSSCNK